MLREPCPQYLLALGNSSGTRFLPVNHPHAIELKITDSDGYAVVDGVFDFSKRRSSMNISETLYQCFREGLDGLALRCVIHLHIETFYAAGKTFK